MKEVLMSTKNTVYHVVEGDFGCWLTYTLSIKKQYNTIDIDGGIGDSISKEWQSI